MRRGISSAPACPEAYPFFRGKTMFQALYRKWRPRVFEDVAGQPQIITTLKNEILKGSVAHAYLFTGSRGTGRLTPTQKFLPKR